MALPDSVLVLSSYADWIRAVPVPSPSPNTHASGHLWYSDLACHVQGQEHRGEELYTRALELNPQHLASIRGAAALRKARGDVDRARNMCGWHISSVSRTCHSGLGGTDGMIMDAHCVAHIWRRTLQSRVNVW